MVFRGREFNLSTKQTLFILFILYLFTLGVRIYWLSQKKDFYIDEVFSVQLSCRNDLNYKSDRAYTGKELKEISLMCHNNVFEDIYHLWQDNNDPPHTNLYYSVLRLALIGLESTDINKIIFRGGIVNLAFFTISFIFFFLLIKLLFPKSQLLQLTATACAFLSTATISNTLFLRPYQIQEASFIVFCYYFFKTFDMEKCVVHNENAYAKIRLTITSTLVTSFALLTGYLAALFVGLFGLYAIYQKIKSRRGAEILFYAVVLFLAVAMTQIFYLKYLSGYFSMRTTEEGHRLTDHLFLGNIILADIKNYFEYVAMLISIHFFTYPVIIVCMLCLLLSIFYAKKNFLMQKHVVYIFIVAVIYSFVVIYLVPWKKLRYIMSVFPFFIMIPSAIIYSIRRCRVSAILMLLLFVSFSVAAFERDRIDHLFNQDVYVFRHDPTVPVFIFNNSPWKYADLVSWLDDDQMYYFNATNKIDLNDNKEVYVVVETTPEMMKSVKLSNVEQEQNFLSWFFIGAKVRSIK